jgi:hypothetical protein
VTLSDLIDAIETAEGGKLEKEHDLTKLQKVDFRDPDIRKLSEN